MYMAGNQIPYGDGSAEDEEQVCIQCLEKLRL
jgi:hypothetical protein